MQHPAKPFLITLRAARVNCGLTLKDVSSKVGKSEATIAKYENDSTSIPRDLMEALCALYGAPKEIIFFGRESDFIGSRKMRSA
jgi:transcriptional regulator with XRE-family HTH domain